uniref:Apelin n=1 Tax=Astatotilapia calliptera TaxID=8154 RepID=A0A3P8N9Z3_ASTCA
MDQTLQRDAPPRVLVLVLNWSFLSVCLPGPMASTVHGRELQDASMVRKMVQQNSARGGQTHRPTSSKRRRPRPRLSHKGPMPF